MKNFNLKKIFSLKRRLNLMVIAITIVFLILFVSPAVFSRGAQAIDTGLKATAEAAQLSTNGDLVTIIGQIIYTILGFLGVAFVILVLYGGAIRMFAKGDAGKIKTSTGIMTSAVVGVAIVLASYIITAFVISQIAGNLGESDSGNTTADQTNLCPGICTPVGSCTQIDMGQLNCQSNMTCCYTSPPTL